jgi:hypothetical protein
MAESNGYRADSPFSNAIEVDDYEYNDKDDPKRRISNITVTSVSSFPDSAWPSDSDIPGPFYSNAKPRPAYHVGSLRRSPLPDRLSPSSLRPPKHTSHRPRSRDEHRRPKSRGEDVTRQESLQETPAPLVLLHITVLPPRLPWNRTVLDATLSPELKRQFGVLRAATSGLVAQRGILIAHPREEFELLEESVLEALDLLPERIGYDGQYRPRTPNTLMGDEDEEAETPVCETCQRVHVGDAWYTRVYAANGLMRAGAWGACWSEMERVDVEVRPCISEHICRRLDEMQLAEDTTNERASHCPPVQSFPEVQLAETPKPQIQSHPMASIKNITTVTIGAQHTSDTQPKPTKSRPVSMYGNDLPPIYQPKDVPLRLLLHNYLYLVLRDRRNVAIFFLVLALLASTAYAMLTPQESTTRALSMGKALVYDEVPIPPVILPRIDVGHGKRHPIWKKDTFEPQEDVAPDGHCPSSEVFGSDQRTEHMSKTVTAGSTVQVSAAATTSVAVTDIPIYTEPASTFSNNPAFLPLLHRIAQCLPHDQQF